MTYVGFIVQPQKTRKLLQTRLRSLQNLRNETPTVDSKFKLGGIIISW